MGCSRLLGKEKKKKKEKKEGEHREIHRDGGKKANVGLHTTLRRRDKRDSMATTSEKRKRGRNGKGTPFKGG